MNRNIKKRHQHRKKKYHRTKVIIIIALALGLLFSLFYLSKSIRYYWSILTWEKKAEKLKNSLSEEKRIHAILDEHHDKVFGVDISHYQELDDVHWDKLYFKRGNVPIDFVIMRTTMGKNGVDKNYKTFWKKAKEHGKIRGAYHFYRPTEDPILQAKNFIFNTTLERGDLPPVLDIETHSVLIDKEKLVENLKIWSKVVEDAYGTKPIIYTYDYYMRDVLKDNFPDHLLWIANYNEIKGPSKTPEWKIWQFSEKGILEGMNTKVDVNVFNGNMWQLKSITL